MARKLLIDTNILVGYLRGKSEAAHFLESEQRQLCVSVITVAELFAGVREGHERRVFDSFVEFFQVIQLGRDIVMKGRLSRRDFGESHDLGIADALIGATAQSIKAVLVTLNKKHFPMIQNLLVPY